MLAPPPEAATCGTEWLLILRLEAELPGITVLVRRALWTLWRKTIITELGNPTGCKIALNSKREVEEARSEWHLECSDNPKAAFQVFGGIGFLPQGGDQSTSEETYVLQRVFVLEKLQLLKLISIFLCSLWSWKTMFFHVSYRWLWDLWYLLPPEAVLQFK